MSLLAKELGVGTVIYNDIYEVSCADMSGLSRHVGPGPDHIVCGDLDALASALHHDGLRIDAVASYDLLEHIYDVESHLRNLGPLSAATFRAVYASRPTSRIRVASAIEALQWEAEHEGWPQELRTVQRGTTRPYLSVRRDIIESVAPDLPADVLDRLARRTRGLAKGDIEATVGRYRRSGSIGYRPDHPTNTCDPLTGDWCERLLRPERLEEIARRSGFDVEIHAGRYPVTGTTPIRLLKRLANGVIRALGRRALFVAPYYVRDVAVPAADER